MTDMSELKELQAKVARLGGSVDIMETDGQVQVRVSAKGVGPYPMSPVAAAERMRQWVYDNERR